MTGQIGLKSCVHRCELSGSLKENFNPSNSFSTDYNYLRGPQPAAHAIYRGIISILELTWRDVDTSPSYFQHFKCGPSCQSIRIGALAKDHQMSMQIFANLCQFSCRSKRPCVIARKPRIPSPCIGKIVVCMGTEHTVTEHGFW